MKNLKNKFIFFVIFLIALVIGVQVFFGTGKWRDTNSYFTLLEGMGYINEQQIDINKKNTLTAWDRIETKEESFWVIEWGDGSVTRISGNSIVVVKEAQVSVDNSSIQIAFELISGKSWSKITSFLWESSYFHQYIDNLEAWVRGTTFEVNKDAGYISVVDHSVTLKDTTWKTAQINENQAFSLSTFSLIEIQKFLQEIQDTTWQEINQKLDNEIINKLKQTYHSINDGTIYDTLLGYFLPKNQIVTMAEQKLPYNDVKTVVDGLSVEEKNLAYTQIKQMYQTVHFASSNDIEEFKDKIYLRKLLLLLSQSDAEQSAIIQSSVYDVQDMVENKNYTHLVEVLGDIQSKQDILKTLNFDFSTLFDTWVLPTDVIESISSSLGDIWGLFGTQSIFTKIEQEGLWETIKSVNEAGQGAVKDVLDTFSEYIK